ncbi:MAG: DUF4476 domain-containing protein [Bacteroidales bacterium]|nr:DUF4476 domain-containing protein [Bacteroidales bacterium]
MKKFCLFVFIALTSAYSFAQNASVTFESERSERFWVYINGKQQNHHPESFIQVDGLYADWDYNIRIVVENKRRSEMTTVMRLHHGNNNYSLNCNSRSGQINLNQKHGNYPPHPQNGNHNQHGNHNQQPPHGQYPPNGQHPQQGNYPPQPPQGNFPPQGQFPPQQPPQGGHHGHHNPPQVIIVEQPAQEPVIMPCSDADFIEAKHTIENADFEQTKLTIAKQIVASELMTASQLAEIARLFDFESTKLEFLKYAYAYCFDKNKYYLVNNVFDFSSSVDELNKYISRQ